MSDISVIHREQRIILEPVSQTISVLDIGRPGPEGPQGPAGPTGPSNSLGEVGFASATGTVTHGAVSDVTGLSVTFNAVLGRKYRIWGHIRGGNASVVGVRQMVWITDDSNNKLQMIGDNINQSAGGYSWECCGFYRYVPGASGSVTFKIRGEGSGGTFDTTGAATAPLYILAEDIGAV